ncbi:MAG: acyl-homoserine-lactone acylase, partial [Sphingomonas hengshuiensis]
MHQAAWGLIAAALATGSVGAGSIAAAKEPRLAATITRTSYGIPHIKAANWGSAGYGIGYAYAEDNLCLLAEEFATVAGDRSRYWGPGGKSTIRVEPIDNLSSDIFFRAMIDLPA